MEKLKIAVVGLGNRGQLFAEYVLGSSDAALVAIADCSASAREKAQNEYKLTPQSCYESADDHVIDLTELADDFSVHGGGDKLLFEDFISYLRGNESSETHTTLKDSLLSHKMSFAAEYSRLHGGIPVKIEE